MHIFRHDFDVVGKSKVSFMTKETVFSLDEGGAMMKASMLRGAILRGTKGGAIPAEELFKMMDKDGNGRVSKAELGKVYPSNE